jgi:hypothetical protein
MLGHGQALEVLCARSGKGELACILLYSIQVIRPSHVEETLDESSNAKRFYPD